MPKPVDLALVLAVAVATAVPFVDPAPGAVTALGVALNLGTVVPLLWRRRAPFAVMLVVATAATLVSLHDRPGQKLQYGGLVAAAFLLGTLERSRRRHAEALRERAAWLERERAAEAARAAAEERARVARDMHDILAHAVSLMVVQAEAGPVVLRTDPARAERAFDAIADAGRDARAGRVTVELAWLPESLQVSVTDDGAGPGPGTPPAGTA